VLARRGSRFTDAENAAVDGRIAVSRSRYNEALIFFRIVLDDSPELFLRYPDLLADLGRTFQYTATGNEGINLFLEWEKTVSEDENGLRYLLFFYFSRIARQRDNRETSTELFTRALPFAPETQAEQADSCIWYILDSSLAAAAPTGALDAAISLFETYISVWHDDTYFFDVTDKLIRELIIRQRWNDVLRIFGSVRYHSSAMTAKCAWIIGRAVEEGLLSAEETRRAEEMLPATALSAGQTLAEAYKRVAWNESGGAGMNALYYRCLSAAALGETFLALPTEPPVMPPSKPPARKRSARKKAATQDGESEMMKFLLGFFEHGAAEFAPRYIRAEENNLSADYLRRLAEALGAAGQCRESMRLVSLYAKRDGHQIRRGDLELGYPRPYKDIVEKYAGETGIDPALLFGLIRTESAFDSNAVSRVGAIGLTQLMPATAEETAVRIRRQGGPDYIRNGIDENDHENSGIDLRDPAANIHIGASYLAFLNGRMEDPLLALLAYNGGMNRVRRWRTRFAGTLPPDLFLETVEITETMEYGRSVTAAAAVYRVLYY
jgi:soluble lytic murein transglycosylase